MKIFRLIIFCIILFCRLILPQNSVFEKLTVENGLSNSNVNCLLQDKQGFIWIGTDNGLNRFDGNDFRIFRNDPSNAGSISDNSIWSVYEDKKGNIWAGTKNGKLNKYSQSHEKFTKIIIDSTGESENSITAIIEDRHGKIWIGTYSHGLYNYDPSTGTINNWQYEAGNKNSLSNNFITSLLEDINGTIWISTYNGLNNFNPDSFQNQFNKFFANSKNQNSLSNNLVWKISQSKYDWNVLWIGTANGLCSYNLLTKSFTRMNITQEYSLQFSAPAQLDHFIEVLASKPLPTSRQLSSRRGLPVGPNGHWLSRLPARLKATRKRAKLVHALQSLRAILPSPWPNNSLQGTLRDKAAQRP